MAQTDTDGDGLSDVDEQNIYGTDYLDPDSDSDNDSLWDGTELNDGTLLMDADTDDDGISDGDEVNYLDQVPSGSRFMMWRDGL